MCIGIPMQIVAYDGAYAICTVHGELRRVDTALIEAPLPGSWVLVFLDSAREVLSSERAAQIDAALQAVQLTMRGETEVDHLFADLLEREPQLPEFLLPHAKMPCHHGDGEGVC
jgi:hydrogenase expression/formation protein HypC